MGYSPVVNDSEATELVRKAALKVVGEKCIVTAPKMMGGEDFSAYTDVVPGSFFVVGGGTAEEGCGYMNHHPKFKINEGALAIGAEMEIQLITDLLINNEE